MQKEGAFFMLTLYLRQRLRTAARFKVTYITRAEAAAAIVPFMAPGKTKKKVQRKKGGSPFSKGQARPFFFRKRGAGFKLHANGLAPGEINSDPPVFSS